MKRVSPDAGCKKDLRFSGGLFLLLILFPSAAPLSFASVSLPECKSETGFRPQQDSLLPFPGSSDEHFPP